MTDGELEREFEGERIAPLLRRQGGEAIVEAITGCRCYRVDPDAFDIVLACNSTSARLTVRTPAGRVREVALAGSYIVSNDGRLTEAVEQSTTDSDRADVVRRRQVASFGIAARIEDDDLETLAAMITMLGNDLPEREIRHRTLALARKYGTAATALRFTNAWYVAAGRNPSADVMIDHVVALRDLGRTREALAVTDVLIAPPSTLRPFAQSVLFTQRAALWLDLYEEESDPLLLDRANRSAARSWAIRPSDECGMVYRRLEKLTRDRSV